MPPTRFFPTGNLNAGKAFVAMDRLLDKADTGPLYLARPENPVHAGLVAAAEDYPWSSAARALQDDAGLKPGAA